MTFSRRRFLTITAAAMTLPAARTASASEWQGRAFGADVAIRLSGPRALTDPALKAARSVLEQIEQRLSLYEPNSALSRLNSTGKARLEPHLDAVLTASRAAFRATEGLFDPTIQPLWRAYAQGQRGAALAEAAADTGFDKVRITDRNVQLGPRQALTFNGIAQGYATDCVTDLLRAHGLEQALINIGEHRALGGPFRLALVDPEHGRVGHRSLTNSALATSSPGALDLGAAAHIVHPSARPHWSTVSVEAASATIADALSTALSLAPLEQITRLRPTLPDVRRITLVDSAGDVTTLL